MSPATLVPNIAAALKCSPLVCNIACTGNSFCRVHEWAVNVNEVKGL